MKEAAFRNAVLTKLPARFHRQPNLAGAYGVAGTPDTYLDGQRDLWVEWKSVPGEDYYPRELKDKYLPTPLQRDWLNRRYANGGNALCIVGFKLHGRAWGVVLATPEQWSQPVPRESYQPRLQRAGDLALYLEGRLT